ncbi:hypothetical protein BOW53_04805 [Solemya pervernicosa gill symbiont]|uniref:Molecular chaperone Skp n=2 Tax=Gammaproteobacteria incertae sedis TaxID=118884 RepID=A0A1T2L7V7_9GAMM|nr:OmpH family outer membrane protein [Candidatus Reidiella endopervernicosa]OOZ41189.1 hypothetical protein BOW53_04805 [Solemya pervernicosa gill symbiont]QKQ27086.1 OmpH family outer membrane protein [Candidatus Reidiella endopervernicosa]
MKKISALFVSLLMLAATTGTAWAQEYKVGFVNTAKLLESTPHAKAARDLLAKEFKSRDELLVSGKKALSKDEDMLSKDGAIMSESARRDLERSIRDQKRDLKRSQEEFREDFNIRRNEELRKLQRTVYDAITAEAKSQKFDIVMGEGVIFASTRVDLTEAVMKRLKAEFGK